MVWHGETAAGVAAIAAQTYTVVNGVPYHHPPKTATGVAAAAAQTATAGVAVLPKTATGVAAAAAETASGVARPAPVTEEELLAIGWPCHWPPTAASKAGAQSKATAWCTQLQLQGDTLIERLPPPPKAAIGADVAGKAAASVDRQPSLTQHLADMTSDSLGNFMGLPQASRERQSRTATRRRKRAKAVKALSKMTHMQAMVDIRCFTKALKKELEKVRDMRYAHWDRLGYRLNIITRTRIKEGRIKKLTSVPEIRKRAAATWAFAERNTPVSRPRRR